MPLFPWAMAQAFKNLNSTSKLFTLNFKPPMLCLTIYFYKEDILQSRPVFGPVFTPYPLF
jgi:hypothetical protein